MPTYSPSPYNKNLNVNFLWNETTPSPFKSNTTYTLFINGQNWNVTTVSTSKTLNFGIINPASNGTFTSTVTGGTGSSSYNKSISVTITCFVKGTKILCKHGYTNIEDIKINDEVKTLKNGFKKVVKTIKYTFKNDKSISQIHKIKSYDKHHEDLLITGGHSLLVDELTPNQIKKTNEIWNELKKIDDKYLLLATVSDYEKIDDENEYELYHIILENTDTIGQYGIYANGILTESMSISCYDNITKNCVVVI